MFKTAIAWIRRGGIGRRIALTMIVSLAAVQLQGLIQVAEFTRPEMVLTTTGWFTDATVRVSREVFAVPPAQRPQVVARLEREMPLAIKWGTGRPWPAGAADDHPVTQFLLASVRSTLGANARTVEASLYDLHPPFPFPGAALQVRIAPPGLGPPPSGAQPPRAPPDTGGVIEPNLRLAVQGSDGSWLGVAPIVFNVHGVLGRRPYVPLLVGGLIIALISVLTARSIVTPLNRLVHAAKRIGRSRQFVPVPRQGLHEFSAVAEAFEEMQVRLLGFVSDRTQMLAAISHDLRSSLTRLRIAAESGDAQGSLLREVDDMHEMLESTLTFARGDADRGPSQAVDVAALIISIVDDAVDAGWTVTYEGPDHAEIQGFALALKRAFRNLVENAVKYGKSAHVTLIDAADGIRVLVKDQGPGIAPERVAEALSPFRRLDEARSGAIPGAGLGLPIAQDAIQSHGGTLVLSNAAGGGLVVEVTLRRSPFSAT